jgi:hypothetical protein
MEILSSGVTMVKMQNSLQNAKKCAFRVVEMRLDAEIRKSESITSCQWLRTFRMVKVHPVSVMIPTETIASQSKGTGR